MSLFSRENSDMINIGKSVYIYLKVIYMKKSKMGQGFSVLLYEWCGEIVQIFYCKEPLRCCFVYRHVNFKGLEVLICTNTLICCVFRSWMSHTFIVKAEFLYLDLVFRTLVIKGLTLYHTMVQKLWLPFLGLGLKHGALGL